MSTCYVLGAGFSREMAGLPMMRDMVGSFRARHRRECDEGHEHRAAWGSTLLGFIDSLAEESVYLRMVGSDELCEWSDFTEDFEAILSFIDLNADRTIRTTIVSAGGERVSRSKDNPFSKKTNLLEIRRWIATYLRLVLGDAAAKDIVQMERFVRCLAAGDSILTFNYDLIVEKELWQKRLWSPSDGYGVEFRTPRLTTNSTTRSAIHIYKLHGSLNWRSPGFFESEVELEVFHDDGRPIFPGYFKNEENQVDFKGGHAPCWVMPSFIKNFAVPELLGVWERGQEELRKASEVIVIGYSLPEADSAACLLLGTSGLAQKRLTIVDPNAKVLLSKFKRITGNKDIASFGAVNAFIDARLAE